MEPGCPTRIRDADLADVDRVAAVHVASWERGYRGLLPDDFLDLLEPAQRIEYWRGRIGAPPPRSVVLVVEDDEGVVCGLGTIVEHADLGPDWAGLPQLYLDPRVWGGGLGTQLLRAVVDRARALGYAHVELDVLTKNTRARHVYERDGWTTNGVEYTEEAWGIGLRVVRYTRTL